MATPERFGRIIWAAWSVVQLGASLIRRTVQVWRQEGFRHVIKAIGETVYDWIGISPTTSPAYRRWLDNFEPDAGQLADQHRASANLPYQPLLSVITPVFDPPPAFLRAAIDSVLAQTYHRWELCLVDGGSRNPAVREELSQAAARDSRIRVAFLPQNLGISGNSNEALRLATGELVIILDHDDLLAPSWLYQIARQLNLDPSLDVIYCDEDKVSEDGKEHFHVWMKPDWSPELLNSANFLMHSAFRRRLVVELGGFRPETDGAQDWDLALRVTTKTNNIIHIPNIMYHWRVHAASAARSAKGKPWAFAAHPRVLRDHLARSNIKGAEVKELSPGRCRLSWSILPGKVTVVVTSPDDPGVLPRSVIALLEKTRHEDFQVVVVGSAAVGWPAAPNLEVISPPPFGGPAAACNLGARRATGDILVFLDAAVTPLEEDWLSELVLWATRPEIGAVGGQVIIPKGGTRQGGQVIGLTRAGQLFRPIEEQRTYSLLWDIENYRNYLAVSGTCLAIRRAVFDEVGGFDEGYLRCFGDVDFCLRVADRGYRNLYTPFARFVQSDGPKPLSPPPDDVRRAVQRLLPVLVAGDPYYSPNLSYADLGLTFLPAEEPSRRALLVTRNHAEGVTEEMLFTPASSLTFAGLLTKHRLNDTRVISYAVRGKGLPVLLAIPDLARSPLGQAFLRLACLLRDRGDDITAVGGMGGRLVDGFAAERIPTLISPLVLGAPFTMSGFLKQFSLVIAGGVAAAPLVHQVKAQGGRCLWLLSDVIHRPEDESFLAGVAVMADVLAFSSAQLAECYRELTGRNDIRIVPLDEPPSAHLLLGLAEGLLRPAPPPPAGH